MFAPVLLHSMERVGTEANPYMKIYPLLPPPFSKNRKIEEENAKQWVSRDLCAPLRGRALCALTVYVPPCGAVVNDFLVRGFIRNDEGVVPYSGSHH